MVKLNKKIKRTIFKYSPPNIPIKKPIVAVRIGLFKIQLLICSLYLIILLPITNLCGYLCALESISVIVTPTPGSDACIILLFPI